MSIASGRSDASRSFEQVDNWDLVATVSKKLIRATDGEIEATVQSILSRVGESLELDRVTVWRCLSQPGRFKLQAEWEAPGIDKPPGLVTLADFPWAAQRLIGGAAVRFSDLDELPEEANIDRRSWQQLRTKSHYSCPLRVAGRTVGVLALSVLRSHREWSDVPEPLLRLLTDSIAMALARKKASEDLQRSEERHRSFVANSTEGIWCMEFGEPLRLDIPIEDQLEQIYDRAEMVETNDVFARMHGYSNAAEMGPWTLKDFMPRDSQTMDMIRQAAESDYTAKDLESVELDRYEKRIVFLNNLSGQIKGDRLLRIWGTQRDITAVRSTEEAARLQAAAIEALTIGCTIADARAREFPIIFANSGFCQITGYSQEEVLGRKGRFLEGPDTDQETAEAIREALRDGQPFEGEILNYRKDGTPVWLLIRLAPIFSHRGTLTHVVGTQADVSNRRSREEELLELRGQLAHTVRRGTLGELSAAIAHEISQPLTAIASNAHAARRLLSRGRSSDSDIVEILDDIVADNERAAEVMQRLRNLLSAKPTPRKIYRIGELVTEVVELLRSDTVFRNMSLRYQLADDLPPVLCDGVQIQQVLINLIRNGCESVERAGLSEATVLIEVNYDAGEVHFSVRDSGAGFGESTNEQLFEPFQTTKDNGLGMGLSISRTIVESHGGKIWACENTERGATVHFSIPATTKPAEDTDKLDRKGQDTPTAMSRSRVSRSASTS